ncbi:MAG: hypothetical protein L0211_05995, partial [Planctomycetaceae bacterium]|nr:hypothetical protein [Planctomycetaceae bacterium]
MARTPSQNVHFRGPSPGDDEFEPPGRAIAKRLLAHLRAEDFTAADEDNWRDCGWSIDVTIGDCILQLALTKVDEPDKWFAQVAPRGEPGWLVQLLGRKFVERTGEVLAVSRAIHECLRREGYGELL